MRLRTVSCLLKNTRDGALSGPPAKPLLELLKIAEVNWHHLDNQHQKLSKDLEEIIGNTNLQEEYDPVVPYAGKTPPLYDDVIGKILQMLDWTSIANARLVCKSWAQAARKPTAWRYAILTLYMDLPYSLLHKADDPATMAAMVFAQSARLLPARKLSINTRKHNECALLHPRTALFQRNLLAGQLQHLHTLEMNWRCLGAKMVTALGENTTLRHLKIDRRDEGTYDARKRSYTAIISILENNKHLLSFDGFCIEGIYIRPPLGIAHEKAVAMITARAARLGKALAAHPTLQEITLPAIQRDPAEYKTERDTFINRVPRSYIADVSTMMRNLALQNILESAQGLKQVNLEFKTKGVIIGDVATVLNALGPGVERVVASQSAKKGIRAYYTNGIDDRPGYTAFADVSIIENRVGLSLAFHNMLLDRANEQLLKAVLSKPPDFHLQLHLRGSYWGDSYKQLCDKHPEFKNRVTLL
jgi:hypothetical protein